MCVCVFVCVCVCGGGGYVLALVCGHFYIIVFNEYNKFTVFYCEAGNDHAHYFSASSVYTYTQSTLSGQVLKCKLYGQIYKRIAVR